MESKRKLAAVKASVIVGAIPILLWAYEYGPDPGYVAIPGEHGGASCATSGCHSGTANNPSNNGNVTVDIGTTYVPGVKQRITVTINDATQRAWGFQLTARLASSTSTMAGSFTLIDTHSQIMCSSTNPDISFGAVCLPGASAKVPGIPPCTESSTPSCPANQPLQYMEHSYTGYVQTKGLGAASYQFDWTPPATDAGNVIVYVAGNAANGDDTINGDHIYTKKYTLTPSAGGPVPTIAGVSNSAGGQAGVFPNAYVSIYGANFTSGLIDDWGASISGGKLPTSLDGVGVKIGGQDAYVSFVSPTQINALVPNVGLGSMQMTVSTQSGTSAAFTVTSQQVAPAFFPWPNNQPVATHADYTWAVKNSTFAGTTTIPAKPGEAIILWGTGFGPTDPANPFGVAIPSSPTYFAATPATATIGGVPASVYATVLAPGFAGEYQVIVTVPPSLANGDYPVIATINGAQSPPLTLTVQN